MRFPLFRLKILAPAVDTHFFAKKLQKHEFSWCRLDTYKTGFDRAWSATTLCCLVREYRLRIKDKNNFSFMNWIIAHFNFVKQAHWHSVCELLLLVCLRGLAVLGRGTRTDLQKCTGCNRLSLFRLPYGPSVSGERLKRRAIGQATEKVTVCYSQCASVNLFWYHGLKLPKLSNKPVLHTDCHSSQYIGCIIICTSSI